MERVPRLLDHLRAVDYICLQPIASELAVLVQEDAKPLRQSCEGVPATLHSDLSGGASR